MILLLAVMLLQGETILEAGQTLTLTQDLVVPDVFEVRARKPERAIRGEWDRYHVQFPGTKDDIDTLTIGAQYSFR